MNFYEQKINEIRDLIKNNKVEEAKVLLLQELNMPYIPKKYEEIFLNIREELNSNEDNSKESLMTQEEALTILYGDAQISKVHALNSMKKMNIRSFIDEVVKWMETSSSNERMLVANMYELLVEQEINVNIKIDDITLNPVNSKDPLRSEYINKTLKEIEEKQIDELLWKQHAKDQLMIYVLNIFPKPLEKEISEQMLNIVAYLFGEGDLTNEEKEIALTIGHIVK